MPNGNRGFARAVFLTNRRDFCRMRRFPRQNPGFPMYAVVRTGGKQYRVSAGEKLRIEQIAAAVGQEIVLGEVLMVADGEAVRVGTPLVEGAAVRAKVLGHGRADKVRIFKLKRRKHYRRTQGHRQNYTEIEILGIAQ